MVLVEMILSQIPLTIMPYPIVFPSRTLNNFEIDSMSKKERLFEIFSPSKVDSLSGEDFEEQLIEGTRLVHYNTILDQSSLAEILGEFKIYDPFSQEIASRIMSKHYGLKETPKIMGIVNVTPDSFYQKSRMNNSDFRKIDEILEEKPEIIDIGGESTRPGSKRISSEEELKRIVPVVKYVRDVSDISISIDSMNPDTIAKLTDYGIEYINDISGFRNAKMIEAARENSLKCIVMHMRGVPENMQKLTNYDDLIYQVISFLVQQTSNMVSNGIHPGNIIVDPGIGFAKNLEGNQEIFRNIKSFHFGFGLLVGASRKSFVGNITGEKVEDRLPGTISSSIYLMENGTDILRVHDVKANRSALQVYQWLHGE